MADYVKLTKDSFIERLHENIYANKGAARRAIGRLKFSAEDGARALAAVDAHFFKDKPVNKAAPVDRSSLKKRILAIKEATKVSWKNLAGDLGIPDDTLRGFIHGRNLMKSSIAKLEAGVRRMDGQAGELVASGLVKKPSLSKAAPAKNKPKPSLARTHLPSKTELLVRELEILQLLRKEAYS